jgi:hypothetical protein
VFGGAGEIEDEALQKVKPGSDGHQKLYYKINGTIGPNAPLGIDRGTD